MWSSDRRKALSILLAAGLTQAACLRPMLAENRGAISLRHRIALPPVDDRFGYYLNRSLAERFGKPRQTDYRLDVNTTISERGIAITQDDSVTRVTLSVTATWSLWQEGAAEPVLADRVSAQSGYNAATSLFATRQTRRDIERRLARDIGERISRSILSRADQFAQ